MFIVRDIFHLKFGYFKDAKALLDEVRDGVRYPGCLRKEFNGRYGPGRLETMG